MDYMSYSAPALLPETAVEEDALFGPSLDMGVPDSSSYATELADRTDLVAEHLFTPEALGRVVGRTVIMSMAASGAAHQFGQTLDCLSERKYVRGGAHFAGFCLLVVGGVFQSVQLGRELTRLAPHT